MTCLTDPGRWFLFLFYLSITQDRVFAGNVWILTV